MPFKNPKDKIIYARQLYQKNKKLAIERVSKRKKENKRWLEDYKRNLKCIVCGEADPATLDFHHRDTKTKERGICYFVSNGYSVKKILQEIKKCDILCSNCHRKLHYKNNNL